MVVFEQPITLDEQILLMKKYVVFRQRKRMRKFLSYAGYFRASRYGKFLLSCVGITGSKANQDTLFALYRFDVDLRRILSYYCNKAEIRFKSAISNACAIQAQDPLFYLDQQYYTPSKGESDAKTRRRNIRYFQNNFFSDLKTKEEKIRKDVVKYPELKEYRKGGSKQKNKLPIWVTFSYTEFGTATMMYNYLRGDLRKKILSYTYSKPRYSKKETELVDTWLDAIRNLRNYCAHNSMIINLSSSVVLLDPADEAALLPCDTDLYSRLYALRKILLDEDAASLVQEIQKLLKKTHIDIYQLGIFPDNWLERFNKIKEF